ncbi:MAG: fructose-bisphosphatase class III [Phycisphaeraceae bacterium]|nr:fructose-bisphosphatase class III [Phycisphaeraceae bacterium]
MPHQMSEERVEALQVLAAQFPTAEQAIVEAAALGAKLTLPMGVVHVISDIHGEDAKLRHVINNSSGALRTLVDQVLAGRLPPEEHARFLAVLYYPREAINTFAKGIIEGGRRVDWVAQTITLQFEIVKALRRTYRRDHFERLVPAVYRELFMELGSGLRPAYVRELVAGLARFDRDWGAVRAGARLIRNLCCDELLVAGDLGDRGPRMDRVIDTLMRQPRVSLLWGNHDMIWLGAHLGHEPCLLTVLRFSARYRCAAQLEEGYGIMTTPIERLVQSVYADDPAERFIPKGQGYRDQRTVARMQKALAIMQFKAEGRMIERHPEWNLSHRRLLHRIDLAKGTVTIDGVEHPLLDTNLPTINPDDPYAYSPEEQACIDRLRESFTRSMRLREHMEWMVRRGGMWTRRDDVLLFHACVPVDSAGRPLSLDVDGRAVAGRELMDALGSVVRRAMRKRWFNLDSDADWLWYMWGGPLSPLFGKDKLATFESYFVADKEALKENKNPYFELMHDADFIRRIGRLFGCGDDVLVVNGHVPVKVEKGEQPLKRGGNAITIDGAFSQAYGDRGFTLVLKPDRVELAEHSAFTSVQDVITSGADIVPKITTVRTYPAARTIGDTHAGASIRRKIHALEDLVAAYHNGVVPEQG